MIEWIFFDVGNVLFNDDPQNFHAYRYVHEEIQAEDPGYTFQQMLQEREEHARRGEDWILHKIAGKWITEERRRRCFARMKAWMLDHYDANHLANDGIEPVLRKLAGRYRLGVLANQPPECRQSLRRRGWLDMFDVVAISEELGLFKPDPQLFRWAVEQAGCDPSRSIMIGDRRDNDIAPAQSLSMQTILVSWPDAHQKGWKPQESRALAFLDSVNRVALFPGLNSGAQPDRTVTTAAQFVTAVDAIVEQRLAEEGR